MLANVELAQGQLEPPTAPDPAIVAEYRALAGGECDAGPKGTLLLVISTVDLAASKGDVYVGLGLAKYLHRLGWGIIPWPEDRWAEETPEGIDVALVMIESFVPGLVREGTRVIAWVRNWTDTWVELPYLERFSQLWCSSEASAVAMRSAFPGPVYVVPLATDAELFHPVEVDRQSGVVTTANFWGMGRTLIGAIAALAKLEHVTWFGKNARHLQLPEGVGHRHTIDYFSLPWVYSHWKFVVDDVIAAAAAYGTQNSRLFDAIACGAIVITNSDNGLAELGLSDVPVYDESTGLVQAVERLRSAPDESIALAERLTAVVLERHTYNVRARLASEYLTAALATPAPSSASYLLRWTARLREELRSVSAERAMYRTLHYELAARYEDLAAKEAQARAALTEARQPTRLWRLYSRARVRLQRLMHP